MAISLVQQAFSYTVSGGGSPNKSITIATPGAGNALFVMHQNISGSNLASVSGGGVTWSNLATFTDPATTARCSLWGGFGSTGTGTTITVTRISAYGRDDVSVSEWSGLGTTPTLGGSSWTASRPNSLTPTITPTVGSECLLIALLTSYTATVTAGPTGGFTALNMTGGDNYASFAYRNVAVSSGSYQCGWTVSAGYGTAGAGIYSLTPSGGGGGGGSTAYRRPAMWQGMGLMSSGYSF